MTWAKLQLWLPNVVKMTERNESNLPKVREMTKVTCPKLWKLTSNLLDCYVNVETSLNDWQKLFQALTDMCHLIWARFKNLHITLCSLTHIFLKSCHIFLKPNALHNTGCVISIYFLNLLYKAYQYFCDSTLVSLKSHNVSELQNKKNQPKPDTGNKIGV